MKIRSRFLTKLIAHTIAIVGRTLFWTCRKQLVVVGDDQDISAYGNSDGSLYLYSIWHDQIVMTLFTGKPQRMSGLVSKHQDGSFVAETMKLQHILPVRGSTKRGGAKAMRQMLEIAQDRHVSITPDGPRGPRQKLKPGIVFLASHTGRKIIPCCYACKRGWRIKGNWTDMLLPKPFTTIVAMGGPAVSVPADISRAELDEYVQIVESRMDDLQAYADRILAGESVENVLPANQAAEPPHRQAA